MIGYRGALRYMREPELFRLELDGDPPGLGRGPHEPPRDAPVRAHGARARRACRELIATSRPARPARASSCG